MCLCILRPHASSPMPACTGCVQPAVSVSASQLWRPLRSTQLTARASCEGLGGCSARRPAACSACGRVRISRSSRSRAAGPEAGHQHQGEHSVARPAAREPECAPRSTASFDRGTGQAPAGRCIRRCMPISSACACAACALSLPPAPAPSSSCQSRHALDSKTQRRRPQSHPHNVTSDARRFQSACGMPSKLRRTAVRCAPQRRAARPRPRARPRLHAAPRQPRRCAERPGMRPAPPR